MCVLHTWGRKDMGKKLRRRVSKITQFEKLGFYTTHTRWRQLWQERRYNVKCKVDKMVFLLALEPKAVT
jgi:hypothetical protein